jgi:hypothetical protein
MPLMCTSRQFPDHDTCRLPQIPVSRRTRVIDRRSLFFFTLPHTQPLRSYHSHPWPLPAAHLVQPSLPISLAQTPIIAPSILLARAGLFLLAKILIRYPLSKQFTCLFHGFSRRLKHIAIPTQSLQYPHSRRPPVI